MIWSCSSITIEFNIIITVGAIETINSLVAPYQRVLEWEKVPTRTFPSLLKYVYLNQLCLVTIWSENDTDHVCQLTFSKLQNHVK